MLILHVSFFKYMSLNILFYIQVQVLWFFGQYSYFDVYAIIIFEATHLWEFLLKIWPLYTSFIFDMTVNFSI